MTVLLYAGEKRQSRSSDASANYGGDTLSGAWLHPERCYNDKYPNQ